MNDTSNGNGREKLIDRIKKLLALAGNNPNEQEAAAAAEKVQSLLAEHNLSMAEVTKGVSAEEFEIDGSTMTESLPWRRSLATMVARMYFCDYFYAFHKKPVATRACGYIRYDRHSFVGAKHNIVVAIEMFKYLNDTIEKLADSGALNVPTNERSSYRTSFRGAAAQRLVARIHDRIAQAKRGEVKSETTGANLPALLSLYDQTKSALDDFLSEKFGKMKKKRSRITQSNARGVAEGRAAGDRIGLDQQVGRGHSHMIGKR